MNWYIGQEIVCIKSHHKGVVKRGNIYIIKGLRSSSCKCQEVEIDVGIKSSSKHTMCTNCKHKTLDHTDIWWLSETRFAPLEYNQDAINELLGQPILIKK